MGRSIRFMGEGGGARGLLFSERRWVQVLCSSKQMPVQQNQRVPGPRGENSIDDPTPEMQDLPD